MPDRTRDLAKVVEKQMRNWELSRSQVPPVKPDTKPEEAFAEYVAISRTYGSGGRIVAFRLGERLGWPVFDREILQAMAGDDRIRARLYERLDERDMSWLEKAMRWVIGGEFNKDDYFHRLSETVLTIAHQGHAVYLGRGVELILPCERGLRVRVIASDDVRAQRVAERMKISEALARAEMERIDHEREDYRRTYFGKRASAPENYDLIINTDRLSVDAAAEVIHSAMRARHLLRS